MRRAIFFTIFLSCIFSGALASSIAGSDSVKILFIGSSYFNFNHLPELFQNLSESCGKEVDIEHIGHNGLYLADHADMMVTLEKINSKNWDYIVLQGVGPLVAYPDQITHHPVYPALQTLKEIILLNCPSTRIVFCMPWAFEDGMSWKEGWTDLYAEMQQYIYQNTLKYSNELDLMIAPVGWAWYRVLEDKNYPLHYLHLSDWNHPTPKGSYLMACVIFSTIFQEDLQEVSYYADLQPEEAIYFQEIGSETVLKDLQMWNIPDINVSMGEPHGVNRLYLSQNVPNPVVSGTRIDFETMRESKVELVLYNQLGQMVRLLVSEYMLPGQHSIRFDKQYLPEGLYYYSLKSGAELRTMCMILSK